MIFNERLRSQLRDVRDGRITEPDAAAAVLREALQDNQERELAEVQDVLLLRQAVEKFKEIRYRGCSIA